MAAKRARTSGESSRAAVTLSSSECDTSTIASTSSFISQPQLEHPQLSVNLSEGMSIVEGPNVSSDEYESEDDIFDDECAQDDFDKFILSLPLDHRRMLFSWQRASGQDRGWVSSMQLVKQAQSSVTADKTVHKLRKEFTENEGVLKERGKKESTNA